MRKGHKKLAVIFLTAILLLAGYFLFFRKKPVSEKQTTIQGNDPAAQIQRKSQEAEKNNQSEEKPEEPAPKDEPAPEIPEKYLLQIPFYSQAPLSKWDAFHEDMCEEASVLNATLYLEGKKLTKDQFEAELQKMQNAEKKEIGEWKSTTVAEMKTLIDVYFGGAIKSKIIENPTASQIEAEIAAGHPVVVPLAGRDIGNPNFTPPGPVYHMLAIKGYDAQNFITNDVGTRKGESYTYKKEVIMKNIHDWNDKDIRLGAKKILILYK
ncbi:MAG: C39 family peptidase [Patescibacteria group bacterium]|nr:C39 family peptidase [Patescibacteria group bacterium]